MKTGAAMSDRQVEGVSAAERGPGGIPLRCPYCGDVIEVETSEHGYYRDVTVDAILCACGGRWFPSTGDVIERPAKVNAVLDAWDTFAADDVDHDARDSPRYRWLATLAAETLAINGDDEPDYVDDDGRGHWAVAEHYELVGDPQLPLVTHTLPGSMSPNLASCFAEVLPVAAQWTARTCTELRTEGVDTR